jgi:3-oxoacyl-[acyl-carrier protein] reductase
MCRLDGKVALVTAATSRPGAAIAGALARLGAGIAVHDCDAPADAEHVARSVCAAGGRAVVEQSGLTSCEDVQRLFDGVIDGLGRLDVVVHTPGAANARPIAAITDDEYDAIFGWTARSAAFLVREGARRLPDDGRIVLLAARASGPVPEAANAAVETFSRMVTPELADRGIGVNVIVEHDGLEWPNVAPLIAFLTLPHARWISGQTIRTDRWGVLV